MKKEIVTVICDGVYHLFCAIVEKDPIRREEWRFYLEGIREILATQIEDSQLDDLDRIFWDLPKVAKEMAGCERVWTLPLAELRKKLENLNLKNE